jgi:hypothetical protein
MSGTRAQLGVVKETTYGSPVTVTRFFEFNSESGQVQVGRVDSTGMRAGQRVQRSDRRVPYIVGATNTFNLDVLSAGFGWWLELICGSIATTGPVDTTVYSHAATIGDLAGKMFTAQVGVPLVGTSVVQPKTLHGGKVTAATFSCNAGEALKASIECDFEDLEFDTSLAVASYPAAANEPITFLGGTCEIADSAVDITSFSVKITNPLKTDRRYLRGSGLKKQPLENDLRKIEVTLGCDWESTTHQARVLSASAAGAQAKLELFNSGLLTIGGAQKAGLDIVIPVVMFDGDTPTVGGPDLVPQSLKGIGLHDGSNSPITMTYRSTDSTA